jgi:hypothetical protein
MMNNSSQEKNKLTRQELYNFVWSIPLTKLAEKYQISENGLRKICVKLDIPLPKGGYWSKLKFNKKVTQIPFKINTAVDQFINLTFRNNEATLEEHYLSAFHRLKKELEAIPNLNFKVPEILTNPHPLIKAAKADLKTKKPSTYLYSNNIGTIHTGKGLISIDVSKEFIPRALVFMDTFIKLILKRGHQINSKKNSEVLINGEAFSFRFREVLKRIKTIDKHSAYNWEHTELVPSGVVEFQIGESYKKSEWRDSLKNPVENKLSNILAKLELESELIKKQRIKSEIWHREYQRKRKIEEEKEALFQKEVDKFKQLKENAKRWQKTVEIRNYIHAVETNAIKTNTLKPELIEWIKWANNKADWYDPLIQKEDDILNDRSLYD